MSEKTVYECDRCGAVSEERTFGEFRVYSATPASKRENRLDRGSHDPCDLCAACSEELCRFMKGDQATNGEGQRVQFTMTDGLVYDFHLTKEEMARLEATMEREVRWLKVEKEGPAMYLNMRHCTAVCVFEAEGE